MLQQTRGETVIPYYERFLARFPDVERLAGAEPDAVLGAWAGLGYYSRARNLQRAARVVVERHAGRLPGRADGLRELPGIGRYTAGAAASVAFDPPQPRGGRKDVPARDECELPAVGREREVRELRRQADALGRRRHRRAAPGDLDGTRLAGRRVERPDAEVALEDDRA